ncbi:ABC transporter ATP-binding protein [Pseudonocardia alaniniphila]|uniref:ABC transporter ATP-binding protein n=1 Tax=Pseudonocardia alaniniphila TaxID=75291 RepID=A0ABS9TKV0_9PSEU|nr:ABC transporter ATP-binding protein [Pseudonocardia alaniniphila]MCH6169169.1 ABC transporter ATP-binding protein [Pseudonocardia alaniniphila]
MSKRYPGVEALVDFDLRVAEGEFVALVGPSGSGKTTAMRLLGGFERPDSGSVWIGGRDVTWLPPQKREVNTVFQNYALFPHLSVAENIGYGPRLRGVKARERRALVAGLLQLVQLEGVQERRPAELSGGQQQRVAIARALANEPAVLLLDEPLGALDSRLRGDLQIELRRIHRELGTSFVYVTHDQDEAFALADRVVVVHAGRVEQQGSPAEIYDGPATLWAARFIGAQNFVTGRVDAVRGSRWSIATDVGFLHAEHAHGTLAVGEPVVVAVRQERVAIEPSPSSAVDNAVPVRVNEVVEVGPELRVSASTPGGTAFVSTAPRWGSHQNPGVGDDVVAHWPAASAHVYPS